MGVGLGEEDAEIGVDKFQIEHLVGDLDDGSSHQATLFCSLSARAMLY